ncbi:MAG TPA: dethiobiotin synthase [Acidimicrobiales bacterium]|nr:dethiobiotin synthase [Acidimicrobiales bacterium]
MTRPALLVGVCGTATEVGKTFVAAALARSLRAAGRTVAARKPLQSFEPHDPHPTDAEVLAAASGEDPHEVCPAGRWLPVPMAPPMAADALGQPCPTLAQVVGDLAWPDVDVGLLETVGGVRSPLAADGDSRDLVRAAAVDVVLLVADAGLGTIDAVRSAVDQLVPLRVVTVLNRFDDANELHVRNWRWLEERDGFEVVVDVEAAAARLLR